MILYRVFPRDFTAIQAVDGLSRFMPIPIKDLLDTYISSSVQSIILEYPYVDKDYRDTYYNDFAKRHAEFDRNCVRLHFFTNTFSSVNEIQESTLSNFNNAYRGFIVLRDTKVALTTIGRSYLHPTVLNHRADGFISLIEINVHIYGFEFQIKAFPWMQQDANVTRCAHVALWSIIRFYSDKLPIYAEKTLYQITRLLQSEKRTNPSCGMTLAQVSQVFKDCNFFPEIYPAPLFNLPLMLYTLVESGIPSIAALTLTSGAGHAVALIGHGPVQSAQTFCTGKTGIINCHELIPFLIASDDNYLPYTRISKYAIATPDPDGHIYSYGNISALIVPYYDKMLLDITSIFGGNGYTGCLRAYP